MAATEQAVARFKRFLDQVAAETTVSTKSIVAIVSASPAPTLYEIVLGRFTDRLDDLERAELISLFEKMSGA